MAELLKQKDVDLFDYDKTRDNLNNFFVKYLDYKSKQEIIRKRTKCSLAFDNLGIYSGGVSDPTGDKVEQIIKMQQYTDAIDEIINLYIDELTKQEKICLKRYIFENGSNEDLEVYMSLTHKSVLNVKKSCYIKVAKWFDLEVYK